MPVTEASSEETPYGPLHHVGRLVRAQPRGRARSAQRGEGRCHVPARAASAALSRRRSQGLRPLAEPGEPNALYHSEGVQEGFLVLSGDCTETEEPSEAYADWPGEYLPVRLPWPPDSDTKGYG